jgi:hypothetical protein
MTQWEKGWMKFREVILPNLAFQVSIQLRKHHNIKPLVTLQFPGTLGENVSLFWLRKGQLWNQISQDLFRFSSACIYSFEGVFSQLFKHAFVIFVRFKFFQLEAKIVGT